MDSFTTKITKNTKINLLCAHCDLCVESLSFVNVVDPGAFPQRWETVLAERTSSAGFDIQLDSEARSLGEQEFTLSHRVPATHKLVSPRHIVVAEAFLDQHVRRRPTEMDRRTKCDRAD